MAQGNGRVAGAESSRKLLQLLLMFTEQRPLWTVAELAEALGLTQSMAYRYVALLREVGLIEAASGKSYRVSELVSALAAAAVAARPPLAELAQPILDRIRDACRETTYVSRRTGWFTYIVAIAATPHPVRLIFEPGQANVLYKGSAPRLLLGSMSHADRQAYFDIYGVDREKAGRGLLSDQALDDIARRGEAESFEEVGEGIWATSAAVKADGKVVAALSCAAPLFRVSLQQRADMRDLVVAGAGELSGLLAK